MVLGAGICGQELGARAGIRFTGEMTLALCRRVLRRELPGPQVIDAFPGGGLA